MENGFWKTKLVSMDNWIDKQTRFVAALSITTFFMVSLATCLGGLFLIGKVLMAIGGFFGLFVGLVFLALFLVIYNSLGEIS